MLKQLLTIGTVSVALAGSVVSSAIAAPQDFVGTWVNTDANTRGITRLVITKQGGNLRVQVFGQCHPTDCDWGTVGLVTYGKTVQDADHLFATAAYKESFANRILTLGLTGVGRSQISLQNFTQFTDNSNRQNYVDRDTFKRAVLTPKLVFRGTEPYTANGKSWIRYKLAIVNPEIFSADQFAPAPDLPPCGLNKNASRTWVDIYNTSTNQRIYGFCALSSPQDLGSLWFGVEKGVSPPPQVHVILTDRRTNTVYRSNSVNLR